MGHRCRASERDFIYTHPESGKIGQAANEHLEKFLQVIPESWIYVPKDSNQSGTEARRKETKGEKRDHQDKRMMRERRKIGRRVTKRKRGSKQIEWDKAVKHQHSPAQARQLPVHPYLTEKTLKWKLMRDQFLHPQFNCQKSDPSISTHWKTCLKS